MLTSAGLPGPVHAARSPRGVSTGRNAGTQVVTAPVVAYPDDNCWYKPDTLEAVARILDEQPELAGVSGMQVTEDGQPSMQRWLRRPTTVTRLNFPRTSISSTLFSARRRCRHALPSMRASASVHPVSAAQVKTQTSSFASSPPGTRSPMSRRYRSCRTMIVTRSPRHSSTRCSNTASATATSGVVIGCRLPSSDTTARAKWWAARFATFGVTESTREPISPISGANSSATSVGTGEFAEFAGSLVDIADSHRAGGWFAFTDTDRIHQRSGVSCPLAVCTDAR